MVLKIRSDRFNRKNEPSTRSDRFNRENEPSTSSIKTNSVVQPYKSLIQYIKKKNKKKINFFNSDYLVQQGLLNE